MIDGHSEIGRPPGLEQFAPTGLTEKRRQRWRQTAGCLTLDILVISCDEALAPSLSSLLQKERLCVAIVGRLLLSSCYFQSSTAFPSEICR